MKTDDENENFFEFDQDELKSYVEKVEAVAAEKDKLADEITDIYGDAKEAGFSTKVMRQTVAARKRDRKAVQGERKLFEAYMDALGDLGDTPLGRAAVSQVAPRTVAAAAKKAEKPPKPAKAAKPATPPANGNGAARAKRSDSEIKDMKELGRRAALAGTDRSENPGAAGSADAQLWDTGYGLGHQERVDDEARADEGNHRQPRPPMFDTESPPTVN